jgi:hypothetical protein
MRIDLTETTTIERRTFRAITAAIGIPLLWLILFVFARRRRALCIQQFGADSCERPPFTQAILLFAIFISLIGILKTKRLPKPSDDQTGAE